MKFPSIVTDLPFDEYLAIEAANSSLVKVILEESPLHARHSRESRKSTESQQLGTLFHESIEAPKQSRFIVLGEGAGKASNAAREAYLASLEAGLGVLRPVPAEEKLAPSKLLDWQIGELTREAGRLGKYLVTGEQFDAVRRMRDNVFAKPTIRGLIENASHHEATVLALHAGTGCPVKARPDMICYDASLIVDLKTTVSAADRAYARACERFQYDIQAAIGEYAASQNDIYAAFIHLVVESEPPYDCRLKEFAPEAIWAAFRRCEAAFETLARCFKTREWPGYSEEISVINMRIR